MSLSHTSEGTTYCMSIMLSIPEGAKLSWLRQPAVRFLNPKNRERLGDVEELMLCMSENDACEYARGSI